MSISRPDIHLSMSSTSKNSVKITKKRQTDSDAYYNEFTDMCARKALQGAKILTDKVMARELQSGYGILRPPGHHAAAKRSISSYCIYNTIAIRYEHDLLGLSTCVQNRLIHIKVVICIYQFQLSLFKERKEVILTFRRMHLFPLTSSQLTFQG